MKRYANHLINYPFTIKIQASHKKGESSKKRIYCEDIFTFDIETTSFFYESDKKPFLYKPGYDPEYWSDVYAGSLPYIWQFGINNRYYYGREIKDFCKVLDDFPPDMHAIIWIHNASFEWHHLDFLTWDKVFAKSMHRPIKFSCAEYPNIEFRCTLSLENRSLASWGKSLGLPKRVGDLDYNQMRTPLTPLTDVELGYCERDLEVMYLGLTEELKQYGSIWNLPLTSTGKVRKVVKDLLLKDEKYRSYIKELVPENPYQYKTSREIFAGGYTHANKTFVGQTIYNDDGKHGGHYDYTSSYPYEMVTGKFACSRWRYCEKVIPDPSRFETHAYKFHLCFHNIRSQLQNNYIQYSHTDSSCADVDNGRLVRASTCDMWCTETDLMVIMLSYKWGKTDNINEGVDVLEVWEAKKDYLPKPFVEYVLELFHNKTAYKNVPGKESEYALSKAFLNSLFGMCVTALISSDIIWNDEAGEWSFKVMKQADIEAHLEKLRKWRDNKYFLNYDWGCGIANSSRARLWLDLIIPYDKHVIYADTDSIFTNIAIDFTEYNKTINEKIEKVCRERGLDVEKTRPKNPNGETSFLGNLTTEETFLEFRTLGSKRYCERWKSDGKLHLTVAGINKEAVSCLGDNIENFKNGCVFDKDEKDVSKLLHTYVDNMPDIVFPDGYVSHQRRGVNLRPNGYRLKMDSSFDDIINEMIDGSGNEMFDNHLRGNWDDSISEFLDYVMKGEKI